MAEPDQLELIETTHPAAKPLKAAIRKYNQLIEAKNEANGAAKEQRTKILEIVKGMNIKPDADGVIDFKIGKTKIHIAQGEAQLKIKEEDDIEDAPENATGNDDDAAAGAEQESRRRRST